MTQDKDGWPLTKEFAEGLARFTSVATEGIYALAEAAQKAMGVAMSVQEAMIVSHAKVIYAQETGSRATFWDLHEWAARTGRPNLAGFLYANRNNEQITRLFGTTPPPITPPQEDR